MDDIMVLFHRVIVDLMSFDESQFGIFNDAERPVLKTMYRDECQEDATKFIAMLSPDQKQRLALWACERSSFSVADLLTALKKFCKYLEGISYLTYPKHSGVAYSSAYSLSFSSSAGSRESTKKKKKKLLG